MKRVAVTTFVTILVFAPVVALAHTGHDDASGLAHGFVHPVSGIDHVLAMVAVGLLAAQYGGRALWLVPLSFVVAMAIAGVIGMAGIVIPVAEVGIGVSVVVLGLAIAFQLRPPTFVAMAVVGFFALFHGYAHGAELPDGRPHDGRAPDYDDWTTPRPDGGRGLNGDILLWNPVLDRAFEISSMGIRVDPETLVRQLKIRGLEHRLEFPFHRMLVAGELPQSIGGGLGSHGCACSSCVPRTSEK